MAEFPVLARESSPIIASLAKSFDEVVTLYDRIRAVLHALPSDVQTALPGDLRFRMTLDDYVPGEGRTVWTACPRSGQKRQS